MEIVMRRKDREVTELKAIMQIIDGCEILRLGLADGEFPYIVPVNFAYQVMNGRIAFYIHGAMAGRKYELMKRNLTCSFEMDIPLGLECLYDKRDVTMRYRSGRGTADITFLEGEERQRALDEIIMARHEETKKFDFDRSVD